MGGWWMAELVCGGGGLGGEAELFRAALAGLPAPEIDGELPGDGDDGFLARSSGGPRALAQEVDAFGDGRVTGLEADHAPGQLD